MNLSLFRMYGSRFSMILVTVIVSVSILSMVNFGKHMPMDSQSGDCPFSGVVHSMCEVGPFAHIALWQGLFTAIIPQLTLSFLALFVLAYVATFFSRSLNAPPLLLACRAVHPQYLPPTSLQEAFSKGILNPKLF